MKTPETGIGAPKTPEEKQEREITENEPGDIETINPWAFKYFREINSQLEAVIQAANQKRNEFSIANSINFNGELRVKKGSVERVLAIWDEDFQSKLKELKDIFNSIELKNK